VGGASELKEGLRPVTDDPSTPEKAPRRASFRVGLEPEEIVELMKRTRGVAVYERLEVPDHGGFDPGHDFTVELETASNRFRVHLGPPAARGQSGTGLLPLLYLEGTMRPFDGETVVDLHFVQARPAWAMQRWIGFLLTGSLGSVWVLIGGGVLLQRLLFFGMFLAILTPVVVHDLRKGRRSERDQLELLSLMQRILGPEALAEGARRMPYRRRREALGASFEDEDEDD
jgi:hypothetical protein